MLLCLFTDLPFTYQRSLTTDQRREPSKEQREAFHRAHPLQRLLQFGQRLPGPVVASARIVSLRSFSAENARRSTGIRLRIAASSCTDFQSPMMSSYYSISPAKNAALTIRPNPVHFTAILQPGSGRDRSASTPEHSMSDVVSRRSITAVALARSINARDTRK
jgi:hypothetical protein